MLRFCFMGEGESDSLAPLLLPSPKLGRGAGGEGWRGRGVELKLTPMVGGSPLQVVIMQNILTAFNSKRDAIATNYCHFF